MALLWKNVGSHGDSVIADGPPLAARRSPLRVAFENNITDYIISTVLYGLYDGI
jgi:hypothetical protein